MILSGGSYCKSRADQAIPGETRGSALVEFTCDKTVFGPGQPRLIAQLPPGDDEVACAWVIEWRTYVCILSSTPFYSYLPVALVSSLHVQLLKADFGAF